MRTFSIGPSLVKALAVFALFFMLACESEEYVNPAPLASAVAALPRVPAAPQSVDAPEPDESGACDGACVPPPPPWWSSPAAIWMRAEDGDAPSCPDGAPELWTAHADLDHAQPMCSACGCEIEMGGIPVLAAPETMRFTSNAWATYSTYQWTTEGWTGNPHQSDAPDWTPGLAKVDGTGAVGNRARFTDTSVTWYEHTTWKASGGELTSLPTTWRRSARACEAHSSAVCERPGDTCARAPEGFETCTYRPGEHVCPAGYPERAVYYLGAAAEGESCAACTCEGTETKDFAISFLSLGLPGGAYEGALIGQIIFTAGAPPQETPIVTSLGPVGAMVLGYDGGPTAVASGGEPIGGAHELDPVTICCR